MANGLKSITTLAQINPTTTLRYEVPMNGRVQIQVYDILGNHVINLVDKYHDAGSWLAIWNGTNKDGQSVAAGIYVYTINANEFTRRKKMILLN